MGVPGTAPASPTATRSSTPCKPACKPAMALPVLEGREPCPTGPMDWLAAISACRALTRAGEVEREPTPPKPALPGGPAREAVRSPRPMTVRLRSRLCICKIRPRSQHA